MNPALGFGVNSGLESGVNPALGFGVWGEPWTRRARVLVPAQNTTRYRQRQISGVVCPFPDTGRRKGSNRESKVVLVVFRTVLEKAEIPSGFWDLRWWHSGPTEGHRATSLQKGTGLPHSCETATHTLGVYRALGIVLLQGPRGSRFLMSEVPLYRQNRV